VGRVAAPGYGRRHDGRRTRLKRRAGGQAPLNGQSGVQLCSIEPRQQRRPLRIAFPQGIEAIREGGVAILAGAEVVQVSEQHQRAVVLFRLLGLDQRLDLLPELFFAAGQAVEVAGSGDGGRARLAFPLGRLPLRSSRRRLSPSSCAAARMAPIERRPGVACG
jgi:hypothetical protein